MSKATLHNLVDMLNETDIETIYNVLLRFIPTVAPTADEIEAIAEAENDIQNGEVFNLASMQW